MKEEYSDCMKTWFCGYSFPHPSSVKSAICYNAQEMKMPAHTCTCIYGLELFYIGCYIHVHVHEKTKANWIINGLMENSVNLSSFP